ncbi:hypothetical protein F4703DRAFT_1117337 [Phycomyces blakesleeanus]
MGPTDHRCLCLMGEYQAEEVLELPTRPCRRGPRRLLSEVATEGRVCTPTLTLDTPGSLQDDEGEGQDYSGHTLVADPILVANGDEQGNRRPNSTPLQSPPVPLGRIEAITRHYETVEQLSNTQANFLSRTNQASTNKTYDLTWQKWAMWCQTNEKDCLIYDAAMICKYLSYCHHIGIAKTQLNIDRSAIASVFKVIHSNSLPLANHYLIQVFFKALRNNSQYPARPSTPVWDPEKVLAKILDWGPTGDLSDVRRLQFQDITLIRVPSPPHMVEAVHLLVKKTKEGMMKDLTLSAIPSHLELCPVYTLTVFLQKTEHMRSSMPIDHTLFLGFVEGSQPHSIRPSTMSTWIKTTLSECGVDTTIHKGHST